MALHPFARERDLTGGVNIYLDDVSILARSEERALPQVTLSLQTTGAVSILARSEERALLPL